MWGEDENRRIWRAANQTQAIFIKEIHTDDKIVANGQVQIFWSSKGHVWSIYDLVWHNVQWKNISVPSYYIFVSVNPQNYPAKLSYAWKLSEFMKIHQHCIFDPNVWIHIPKSKYSKHSMLEFVVILRGNQHQSSLWLPLKSINVKKWERWTQQEIRDVKCHFVTRRTYLKKNPRRWTCFVDIHCHKVSGIFQVFLFLTNIHSHSIIKLGTTCMEPRVSGCIHSLIGGHGKVAHLLYDNCSSLLGYCVCLIQI